MGAEYYISIHALLAESDRCLSAFIRPCGKFLSTLSLRRATGFIPLLLIATGFLSTLSLRRATVHTAAPSFWYVHFYPRSPCGERLGVQAFQSTPWYFYPRSPCGERPTVACHCRALNYFYPRSPCGERHNIIFHGSDPLLISIHALLAESDRVDGDRDTIGTKFLSTLSLRRATECCGGFCFL